MIHLLQLWALATVGGWWALQGAASQSGQVGLTNLSGPYWRRPGCFRVGHIRPIVIPGCLKFNLSTNACRGYCMSYSLPATDDLQPVELLQPAVELEPAATPSLVAASSPVAASSAASSAPANATPPPTPEVRLFEMEAGSRRERREPPPGVAVWISRLSDSGPAPVPPLDRKLPASGGEASPASEVVSMSQCCSMLETEDVIVSLRCVGQTEIRQFIFKSAKSCECFFCKKA